MSAVALSLRERAFVLAAVRALGPVAAARFCAARSPAMADEATALRDASRRARAETELARPTPRGLEHVDASWYTTPPVAHRPDAATHLTKAAFAHLVPMLDADPDPHRAHAPGADDDAHRARAETLSSARDPALSTRPPDEIESLLVALGRRRVALAFVGAPRSGLAQLCARLGEPSASELLAEVRALKTSAPHDDVKAAQRALFRGGGDWQRPAPASGHSDAGRALFLRAGAGWLAPALARDGDELRRIAQRLPRPLGELLLDEAGTFAVESERAAALSFIALQR